MTQLKTFTRAWYAQAGLRELALIYPAYAIMFGELGVSPFELSLLFFVWSATSVAFEVPSGTLADRAPRRLVLAAGTVLNTTCFLLWWSWPSFWGFLVGFVLWGIGGCLRSGTAEALLHDHLAAHGQEALFARVYGRGEAASAAAVVIAMALGGWAASTGYTLPLLLSAAAPLGAAMVILLFIREPPRSSDRAKDERYFETMRAGLAEVGLAPGLRRPILYLCTVVVAYEVGEEYFGPLLEEAGFSLTAVGLIISLTHLARAAGFVAAERLGRDSPRPGAAIYAVAGGLLVVAALAQGWLAISTLAAFVAATAGGKVLLQASLQHEIEGYARATITSVVGMGQEVTSLILFLGLGAVAQGASWAFSFACLGVALALTALLLGLTDSD